MIIEITAENFLSIKEKQNFSLYADDNFDYHSANLAILEGLHIHRTCGIWGANASGKTNSLNILDAIKYIVDKTSSLESEDMIKCYEPFLLAKDYHTKPTIFTIAFILEQCEFEYSVKFNGYEILDEQLSRRVDDDMKEIFHRKKADNFKKGIGITFDENFYGSYTSEIVYESNQSYLSTAGRNKTTPKILQAIRNFFRNKIIKYSPDRHLLLSESDWKEYRDPIVTFLKHTDTGICDIEFTKKEKFSYKEMKGIQKIQQKFDDEKIKEELISAISTKQKIIHTTECGKDSESFELKQESEGTIKLLFFLPELLNALKKGEIILIDEIEASFHPFLVETILDIFNDPNLNKKNAQLIFSTHNIHILNPSKMRKDQLCLISKNNGATKVQSIFDFEIEEGVNYSELYLEGSFGAVPRIRPKSIHDAILKWLEKTETDQKQTEVI